MNITEIKKELLKLPLLERQRVIAEVLDKDIGSGEANRCQQSRRELLNNKQGVCPHCGHNKYVKFGFKSNSQRYKCKSCKRSFTEYSGTWMAGIHHKEKLDDYLGLMLEEKSLDKIKVALSINKKTAFDWRHKVLASLSEKDKDNFTGITESDETFFLSSEKGRSVSNRKPRKRGGSSKKRGISNDQVAVIVTQDRTSNLDLTVATMGRLKKIDIENAIGKSITSQTVLCSDAHVSYKGFAIDNNIEHHQLKAAIKQRVKNKVYHIQHVNSTHNRLKKWIDNTFWGVSTKYLQQYLNWYQIKEKIKYRNDKLNAFVNKASEDIKAYQKYQNIELQYEKLISTQI
ncbi:MAG: IS1595 family transposase [Flavobacteriaceae bacterium]|tara:strand:- start:11 stop:1042 length:1032 start_codon:yes stop_codon:yes gene_type:complete